MIFIRQLEPSAINNLIMRHMAIITAIAKRQAKRLPKSILLEDMVQTGVLGLLNNGHKFDPERGSFESFAHHVVKGAIIDAYRRRNYQYELHATLVDTPSVSHSSRASRASEEYILVPSPDASPEELLDKKRRCQHVRRAMETLPPSEKKAVEDRIMDEQTYSQTGKAQNRSASWAFYQTRCGLHKMRRSLAMHRLDE